MEPKSNIYPIFDDILQRADHEKLLKQRAKVLWMTGLSGSGKSTVAKQVEQVMYERGIYTKLLDGDNIRSGINADLGFSVADRKENIRRIAQIAKLFVDGGAVVIASFVSPTIEIRNQAREIIGPEDFLEVYINTPLEVCEARDVKGLYKKARAGVIPDFTGISSPFEAPESPAIEVLTDGRSIAESAADVLDYILPLVTIEEEK